MQLSPSSASRDTEFKPQRRRAILILTALLASTVGLGMGTLVRFQMMDSNPSSNLPTNFLNPQQDFPPLADWPPSAPAAGNGVDISDSAGLATNHSNYRPASAEAQVTNAERSQHPVESANPTRPTNAALNAEPEPVSTSETDQSSPDLETSSETPSKETAISHSEEQAPTLSNILDTAETSASPPAVIAAPAPQGVPAPPIIIQNNTAKASHPLRNIESQVPPTGSAADSHAGEP